MKRHLNGILEAIKSGINSAVVEGLNKQDPYCIQAFIWIQSTGIQGYDHISCGMRIEVTPGELKRTIFINFNFTNKVGLPHVLYGSIFNCEQNVTR